MEALIDDGNGEDGGDDGNDGGFNGTALVGTASVRACLKIPFLVGWLTWGGG
jgi:hypothetical protein